MSVADTSDIECWNCGEGNTIIYGGEDNNRLIECDSCSEIIGMSDTDLLSIPSNKEQADVLERRYGEDTKIDKIKKVLPWR